MNILAVGADPHDVELGCFGALLGKKKAGHNVCAVALAPGAYGSFRWEEIEAGWTKARNALRAGGGKGDYLLGKFPIGSLSQDWATVGFVDDLIITYPIDSILAPHHGEDHHDHIAAQRIATSATRRYLDGL